MNGSEEIELDVEAEVKGRAVASFVSHLAAHLACFSFGSKVFERIVDISIKSFRSIQESQERSMVLWMAQ